MEVMAVVGAVASVAQLVQVIQVTSTGIVRFIDSVRDVPEDVRRLKLMLQSMNTKLEILGIALVEPLNAPWLSPAICDSFRTCLLEVRKDIEAISSHIKGYNAGLHGSSSLRLRKRLQYQIFDQKAVSRCTKWLKSSEENLQRIESSIHLCTTSQIYRDLDCRRHSNPTQLTIQDRSHLKPSIQRSRSSLIGADSFWRTYGVFASIVDEAHMEKNEACTTLCIGACLPSWSLWTAVSLSGSFTKCSGDELKIEWSIGMQFRVAHTSPLMVACEQGDVALIQQVLDDGRGGVNDRSACQGLTPLLIAIRGEHFKAVEYLLQRGADPNIADDNQVTPIFAAAGMNPLAHPAFEQLPPSWDHWLNAVRLIVKYGASVFEVVRGRTLAGLNVERSGRPSRTLEFLQFLAAEDSVQLDVVSGHPSWSALCNALRCEVEAVDALRLLSSAGVVLNRISDDGGTALHMAARMCVNAGAIDYLCENGCGRYIDRPDQLGWTPFHYAVVARSSAGGNAPFAKVVALLRRGADPSIRVVENALRMYDQPPGRSTALELLKHARPERFDLLIGVLTHAGIAMPLERFTNCT